MTDAHAPLWLRRGIDGVAYAVALAAALTVVGAAVCLPFSWGWVGVKYWLFIVGILLFGLGTFMLRPKAGWKDDDDDIVDDQGDDESRFERATRRALPDSVAVRSEERWSAGARLFLGSLAVLLTSMLMEFVFGVGV